MRCEYRLKTRQYDVPLHPMDALACRNHCVRWRKFDVFCAAMQPANLRRVPARQQFTFLNHRQGNVYAVDTLDKIEEVARNIAGTASHVQYSAWFIADKSGQDAKCLWGAGWAQVIRIYSPLVLKARSRGG